MEINPSPEPSASVVEATDQDFEAKVIHRSQEMPVLVDFWAPWCGPCRVIGPVLEKLAGEWQGRFELVKVNVDESPMVAQVLRIQSIPNVKLFVNGHLQDEFMGAYPEPEVVRFLEANLPSEQVDDAVAGLHMWQAGDAAGAMRVFEQVLANDPRNAVALIGKGHLLLEQGELEQAREMVGKVNEVDLEKLTDRQQIERLLAALRARIFLVEHAQPDGAEAGELAEKLSRGCQAALQGDIENALETLLEVVRSDRKFKDDAGRKAMVAVFDLLPHNSSLLHTYRQKLSSILFA